MAQPDTEAVKAPTPKPRSKRIVGYAINIALNLLFLYIANNLLRWEAQFVTQRWTEVLGILNVQIILSLIVYISFLVYDGRKYFFTARTILNLLSLVVTYRLVAVFPFDFNGFYHQAWMNDVFPYLLWLGILGLLIAIIHRTANLVRGKSIHI